MKRRYGPRKQLRPAKLHQIELANQIVDEYRAQGLTLTLRQLYYQFVSRDLIPNSDRSYKRLGDAIADGRYAGLIDWTAVEDRTRFIRANGHWESPAEILESAAKGFRFDLWENQPTRVEVWIEKDALLGVIDAVCSGLDVAYFSCRGYVSASEMWRAARRHRRYFLAGQDVVVLHLGDHDPSGVDMTDDIRRRLREFEITDAIRDTREPVWADVHRIALTMDQIDEYGPPPNPAKLSDSRARAYIEQYGPESWELDALDPPVMQQLIRDEVETVRDDELWGVAVDRQNDARERLDEATERMLAEWEAES